jgi:putative PIN family toxin of toxin-antitoxin system
VIRAVVDANVFISALIRPSGPPGRIFVELVEHRSFTLVLSAAIVQEIRHATRYARVRRHVSLKADEIEAWLASIELLAERVEPTVKTKVVAADPDDEKYVEAALASQADFLVSGDAHLLDIGRYERVRIVAPRTFVGILGT